MITLSILILLFVVFFIFYKDIKNLCIRIKNKLIVFYQKIKDKFKKNNGGCL